MMDRDLRSSKLTNLLLAFMAFVEFAYASAQGAAEGPGRQWFFVGDCTPKYSIDKRKDYPAVMACFKPELELGLHMHTQVDAEDIWHSRAAGYAGVHFWGILSLHARARAERFFSLIRDEPHDQWIAETKELFLQVGNAAIDHVRLDVGKMPLPYGLDLRILPSFYNERVKTKRFWVDEMHGTRLLYDNLLDTILEIGYGYSFDPLKKDPELEISDRTQMLSTRISHDISALGGTRLSLFWARVNGAANVHYGGSILNSDEAGSVTAIEWERLFGEERITSAGSFDQLFRISHQTPRRKGVRTTVEYEDDLRLNWWFSVGQQFNVGAYQDLGLIIGYRGRRQVDDISYFSIMMNYLVAL